MCPAAVIVRMQMYKTSVEHTTLSEHIFAELVAWVEELNYMIRQDYCTKC